ncbi:MAG: cobalt transporter [Rhodospirillaceae bacterium]|nr:MAG: cobalt transporter [Rhodospirillaceae bacterium]
MNTHTQAQSTSTVKVSVSELGKARLMAVIFAGAMLFTVGFAQSSPVHNAAHDTRHVQVFPCH